MRTWGQAFIWEVISGSAVRAGGGRQRKEETSKERGGERRMGTTAHEGLSSAPPTPPGLEAGLFIHTLRALRRQRRWPWGQYIPTFPGPPVFRLSPSHQRSAPLTPEKPQAGNCPLQLQVDTGAWGPRLAACSVQHIWSVWLDPWLFFPQMVSPCSVLLPVTAQLLLFQMLVPGPPPATGHFWSGPGICIWCL